MAEIAFAVAQGGARHGEEADKGAGQQVVEGLCRHRPTGAGDRRPDEKPARQAQQGDGAHRYPRRAQGGQGKALPEGCERLTKEIGKAHDSVTT